MRVSVVQIINKSEKRLRKDEVKYLDKRNDATCFRNRSRKTRAVHNSPSVALFDVNSILNSLSDAHVNYLKYFLLHVSQNCFYTKFYYTTVDVCYRSRNKSLDTALSDSELFRFMCERTSPVSINQPTQRKVTATNPIFPKKRNEEKEFYDS